MDKSADSATMGHPSQAEKATTFASLHVPGRAFVMPNPWDIGSTKMLTALGFQALGTTSAGFAFSLGQNDGDVQRQTMLEHSASLVAATHLPVSADLENGYGHAPEFVAQTIELAHQTGLVGASIEDATGDQSDPIYSIEAAAERIRAAAEKVRGLSTAFTLCARAENFLHQREDLPDTIARLQAFQEAGADILYAPGLRSLEDIRTVVNAVDKPVNVIAGSVSQLTLTDFCSAGVARISLGSAMARASYGAMIDAAKAMADKGDFSFSARAPGFRVIEGLLNHDR